MSKSPKISVTRLSDLLAATGFHLATRWYGGYAWSRWNLVLGVSEWVLVEFAGKKYEAVSANVGVGITRTLAFGVTHELLVEVADVREMFDKNGFWTPNRGQAIIETAKRAKAWEQQVAEVAPSAAERYALQYGNELLNRTTHARQRSRELLRQLNSTRSLHLQIQEMEARHGYTFKKAAAQLAEWPGVMQLIDAEELYLFACCAVLTGEEGTALTDEDPLKNDDLMWQIQLVTDGILLWL
jgi:hypothetical protein